MKVIILIENQTLKSAIAGAVFEVGIEHDFLPESSNEEDIAFVDRLTIKTSKLRTEKLIYIAENTSDNPQKEVKAILIRPFLIDSLKETLLELIGGYTTSSIYASGEKYTLNLEEGAAVLNGQRIELTPIEFLIINELLASKGKAVPRERLEEISGANKDGNMVTVYINRLREKFSAKSDRRIIKTIRGGGYTIE